MKHLEQIFKRNREDTFGKKRHTFAEMNFIYFGCIVILHEYWLDRELFYGESLVYMDDHLCT